MEYKDTLNLPQTDFPMKANLPRREPEILEMWRKNGLYADLENEGKDKPLFILHDGPPYANGHIHIGHALNKVLKDIVLKVKRMEGFHAPYVPGWDCPWFAHRIAGGEKPRFKKAPDIQVGNAQTLPRICHQVRGHSAR